VATTTPDLERASAQDVLAYGVEHFHPRLKTACSFQKEETVLAHMLSEITPEAKLFTIDTGVLFPETLATWKRFEERFGLDIEVIDASSTGAPWTKDNCCGQAKVDGLEQALSGVEAWVTGIRREQSPTRADSSKLERDSKRGIWKLNPLAGLDRQGLCGPTSSNTTCPTTNCTTTATIPSVCAPCTLPGSGRDGRWAGDDKTECGIHL